MNPQKIAIDVTNFAKLAKFRQIWSHCVERSQTSFSPKVTYAVKTNLDLVV